VSRRTKAEAFRDPNPLCVFVCVCLYTKWGEQSSRSAAGSLLKERGSEREREREREGPAAPARWLTGWHIHILCGEKSVRTGTSSRAVLGSALQQPCVTPFCNANAIVRLCWPLVFHKSAGPFVLRENAQINHKFQLVCVCVCRQVKSNRIASN